MKTAFWASDAWLLHAAPSATPGAWQKDVLLEADTTGRWSRIEAGVPREVAKARGAELLNGPAIAPLVNSHSHAFQRAFAGFAERRETADDDFWSWRDRMYGVALTVTPERMKAIAARLYRELLRGGYTHVCEFHYVHHQPSGVPYEDPHEMSVALIEAAHEVGIGITLLPVVYERAGFNQDSLRDDQRRFHADAQWVLDAQRSLRGYREMHGEDRVLIGAALHSLRAATDESIERIVNEASGPIHIHIAEQRAEIEACLKATGKRSIEYLCDRLRELSPERTGLQLVHATHSTKDEIDRVSRINGALVICPTTEANLGDGVTDVAAWLDAGIAMTIGSDSHVCRDWREELRLLEYGQRLAHERRNVLAAPDRGSPSTAERLYVAAINGSAAAAGLSDWGLRVGARADLLVIDKNDPALHEVPTEHLLDAMVFSSPVKPFEQVMVAGQWLSLKAM